MADTLLVTDWNYPDLSIERSVLDGTGVDLVPAQADSPAEVVEAASEADADALLVQHVDIPESVFEALDLRAVGRYGIGVDEIDLEAADRRGVAVVNVPDYCVDEVPTHALSLLLGVARKTVQYDRAIRDGEWGWTTGHPVDRLAGSTLGIVGFGTLGRRFARLVDGFDFRVVAYDPYVESRTMEAAGVEKVGFDELLERSRAVSLHAPLTRETRGMFGADEFDLMREDALLVNTARGPIVDLDALQAALEEGSIAGAGLDVLPEEPPDPTPPFEHPNAVFTPHAAFYSEQSIAEMRRTVTEDLLGILRGDPPQNPVDPHPPWED
ncbi:MAG: C-terminal binding protein [Haloarculaceae archaeon]